MVTLVCMLALMTASTACLGWMTYKLGSFVIDLQNEVDDSVDQLQASYDQLDAIAKMDVMLDEPVVRQALSSIVSARASIQEVADRITNFSIKKQDGKSEP